MRNDKEDGYSLKKFRNDPNIGVINSSATFLDNFVNLRKFLSLLFIYIIFL